MKKKFILFSLLLFCSISSIYSQNDRFLKGQIITTSGEKINGYIKNVGEYERARYVVFKKSSGSEPVKYTPEEIKYYTIGKSIHYQSGSVSITKLEGIKQEPAGLPHKLNYEQLFVRKLVEGEISLYRLDVEIKDMYSPVIEHESKFYYYKDGPDKELKRLSREEYLITLKKEFKDKCNMDYDSKKNQRYNDESFVYIVTKYNDCIGQKSTVLYVEREGNRPTFGLSGGPVNSKVTTSHPLLNQFRLIDKVGYNINAFVDMPIWGNFMEVRGGVSFVHRKATGDSTHIVSDIFENNGEKLFLQSEIVLNKVYIPLQLKVNITKDKPLTPYFLAGIYFGSGINNSTFADKTDFEYNSGNLTQIKERKNGLYSKTALSDEYGWKLGSGFEIDLNRKQKVFLEAHVSQGQNNVRYKSKLITNRTIGLMIGYKF